MADTPPAPIKKTEPLVKWGAILVIALMLLSGAAVFFGSQSSSNTSNTNTPTTPDTPITAFTADDVQGSVTGVFSTAIVGGTTKESDKTTIDEAIQHLAGVKSVNSQFTQLSSADSTLTYVANVTLTDSVDHEAFASEVQTLTFFEAPEIYFQASVTVPTSVAGQAQDGSPHAIVLPNAEIQGIVSPSTVVGDSITGRLSAGFQGETYVNAYMIETQNVSQSPQPLSFSASYPLASLENSLTVTGSLTYFPALSSETIGNGVKSLSGVASVSPPILPQVNRTLYVSVSDANLLLSDMNAFVMAHAPEYSGIRLTIDGLGIDLNSITVPQAKSQIRDAILNLKQADTNISFTDPQSQFLVDLNASGSQSANLVSSLDAYFKTLDPTSHVDVFQNGRVDLNVLSAPDTNTSYPLPENGLQVSVRPGHAIGDLVMLSINGIAIRGKLVFVNGVESLPTDSNATQ